jgi:hypothetical protein
LKRHRDIAAAPLRGASATWQVIAQLIADSLERSNVIDRSDVEAAMAAAAPVGRHLVAGGHLDRMPLTVVAAPIYCTIGTVSGTAALSLEENLDPVPGGATATEFVVYLPTPTPIARMVEETATGSPHLSAAAPPDDGDDARTTTAKSDASAGLLNLEALARRKAD